MPHWAPENVTNTMISWLHRSGPVTQENTRPERVFPTQENWFISPKGGYMCIKECMSMFKWAHIHVCSPNPAWPALETIGPKYPSYAIDQVILSVILCLAKYKPSRLEGRGSRLLKCCARKRQRTGYI